MILDPAELKVAQGLLWCAKRALGLWAYSLTHAKPDRPTMPSAELQWERNLRAFLDEFENPKKPESED